MRCLTARRLTPPPPPGADAPTQTYSYQLRAMETAMLCVIMICVHVLMGLYRPNGGSGGDGDSGR